MLFVFGLLAVVAVAMASNRFRFDVIALLVVCALSLSGILSVEQALSGFGNTVVILVAALLVIGEMLDRTGIARTVGDLIARKAGKHEVRILISLMLASAILGGFMSSTAIVAIFIPIVLRIAQETGVSKSKLLIPMSYAALISGMLTLIATPTNLVVNGELKQAGYDGFQFFSFTPLGLCILIAACAYFVLLGRHLLPKRSSPNTLVTSKRSAVEMFRAYNTEEKGLSYRLTPGSEFVGRPIRDSGLAAAYGLRVLSVLRQRKEKTSSVLFGDASVELRQEDQITLLGKPEAHKQLQAHPGVSEASLSQSQRNRMQWELGTSAVLIHPESSLLNKTLTEVEFQNRYNAQVIGMRRNGEVLPDFKHAKLQASDSLLVAGSWESLDQLRRLNHEFIVLEEAKEQTEKVPAYRKAPIALTILAMLVAVSVLDLLPLTITVLLAALAAVFTRCMTMEDAYRSIHWNSIVLIAGLLPMADALQVTGGTEFIVDGLMGLLGSAPYSLMFTALFFLTAGIGLFLSNTASAVLIAPIAITTAQIQEVSPIPYAIAVMIAASAAYSTPVSTPVVTLVMEPGAYKFGDYVKVGVPLLVITWLVTLLVTPWLFPY